MKRKARYYTPRSDTRCGMEDLTLPKNVPGASIMSGKVNPTLPKRTMQEASIKNYYPRPYRQNYEAS